jgi:hypothetical protein
VIVREAAMLRPAGVRESNPSFGPSDARQVVAIVIAAGFAAMGAAVVLRLKQLQSD